MESRLKDKYIKGIIKWCFLSSDSVVSVFVARFEKRLLPMKRELEQAAKEERDAEKQGSGSFRMLFCIPFFLRRFLELSLHILKALSAGLDADPAKKERFRKENSAASEREQPDSRPTL